MNSPVPPTTISRSAVLAGSTNGCAASDRRAGLRFASGELIRARRIGNHETVRQPAGTQRERSGSLHLPSRAAISSVLPPPISATTTEPVRSVSAAKPRNVSAASA